MKREASGERLTLLGIQPNKKVDVHEDFCFKCNDGGSLLMCDQKVWRGSVTRRHLQ